MDNNKIRTDPSCMDDHDPASLTPAQANQFIHDAITTINETETVTVREALGRILAKEIISTINVPSHTNSAMDGYAIRAEDIPETGLNTLTVTGTSFAGRPFKGEVARGECIRIMTGAVMPKPTDTVVIQEQVNLVDDKIQFDSSQQATANVRQAGEDIAIGDTVLSPGRRLSPADIGLVASLGQSEVEVFKPLKVAFFSTGDELCSIGDELEEGMIYDSNRYTLYSMLSRLGVEIFDLGVIRDNETSISQAFDQAASCADVVITSGGVSVGEADFVKSCLDERGKMHFWKVAMKPGRPLTFGKIDNAFFFGLPGNPVSVMVTFYQFVQPALRQMMGEHEPLTLTMKVRCESKLKKRPGRVEYQRGVLKLNESGEMVVEKTGAQGSGILRSMSRANCFIILPLESTGVEAGAIVDVQPFFGLV